MASDPSDPLTQVMTAYGLLTAPEGPTDVPRAAALVRAACDQNDPRAWRCHAVLAALGLGFPQDLRAAFDSISKAAALGDEMAVHQITALTRDGPFDPGFWLTAPAITKHHAAPRVATVEAFIPKTACAWIAAMARPRLQPSRVKLPDGSAGVDPVRTSSGAGFPALEPDLVVQLVRLRIAAVTGLPVSHQEPTNVMRYAPGEEYRPHYDFITPDDEGRFAQQLQAIGQRAVTLLVYLNESYEGGETAFPRLDWRFKGKTGDALIFWNLSEIGEREKLSLHAGLPVTRGEKLLLSQWVRERPAPLGMGDAPR